MNIIKCQDVNGITVTLSKDTWEKHILPKHPEMKGCEANVKMVVQHPREIFQDSINLNKHIIYNPQPLPNVHFARYLRVAIEYKDHIWGKRGYIESAFVCWNIKKGDILIWPTKH